MTAEVGEQVASSAVSFEDVFHRQYVVMVRLAALLTHSTAAADDIVQDAFVALHRHWERIHDPARYLRRSVVNGARSWWRRHRRETAGLSAVPGPDVVSLQTYELLDALRTLPWGQRTAITLRYYAGLPEAEIAAAMGCRPGTVKSHLHRGLHALREVIEP